MIKNRVYRLKKDAEVGPNMPLKAKQELEIVMDVVYINGNMVPPEMQVIFYSFIKNNPSLFEDITRNW